MNLKQNNYAFIDSQNLNLGIQKLGWKLDYRKFRIYLAEKYGVKKAYIFIGFVALNQSLYDHLQEEGFILKFKPTIPDANGKIKGNVDADIVLRVILEINKLRTVLSPDIENCSGLLKQTAKEKIYFMNELRGKLEYKKAPREDKT